MILVFMIVFNVFMAVAVRRQVDTANTYWRREMIKHNCISKIEADAIVPYDLGMVDIVPNNLTGGYEWSS